MLTCLQDLNEDEIEKFSPDQIVTGFVKLWRRQFDTYEDENGKVRCRACKRELPLPTFLEYLINKLSKMKGGDKL